MEREQEENSVASFISNSNILLVMVKWKACGRDTQQKHVPTNEDTGFHSGGMAQETESRSIGQKWKILKGSFGKLAKLRTLYGRGPFRIS